MTKIENQTVQLRNKPFEDMQLEELYSERACHQWHRCKMINCRKGIERKKHWLEENKPILSKEEIKRQYENGEMSENQYKSAFANRKNAINYRMRADDYIDYAYKVVYEQESIVAYIDELIAQKLSKEPQPNGSQGGKKYDPRKRETVNNRNRLNPQQKWATREEIRPLPKLKKARAFWKKYREADASTMTVSRRLQPIVTWDVDKLRQIAKDRGYFTDLALATTISEVLDLGIANTYKLITNGKLSWGQCIVIGSLFEMTPKEFCDVFLSGYFREVADGVYKAHVEDTEALLDKPYQPKRKEGAEDVERTD